MASQGIVIPEEAMDTLAYQIEKVRKLYAFVEDFVTEYTWKLEEGSTHLLPEIEKDISETFETLDNMDRVLRQHITKIMDGTVTGASTRASALAAGVADDIATQPLPPASPRATGKTSASTAPAGKNARLLPTKIGSAK
jgi:hypothetical protein